MIDIQVGSTLTNGSSAARVVDRVDRDEQVGVSGWTVLSIALDPFGETGRQSFIPDYLIHAWRHVPFEWAPFNVGGILEERYIWAPGWRWLQQEIRPIEA